MKRSLRLVLLVAEVYEMFVCRLRSIESDLSEPESDVSQNYLTLVSIESDKLLWSKCFKWVDA
jgi:hypothetical protein